MDNAGYEAQAEELPVKEDPEKMELKKEEGMVMKLGDPDSKTSDEEKILSALREVVRKCTNPDPTKRPTAAEVLDMLRI